MIEDFKFKDDPLKHFVRTNGWLPFCKNRLRKVNQNKPISKQRRLKYFSFCAVEAIDVLMLDVAGVIKKSTKKKFDTVYYFGRDSTSIIETEKRIPGGIGFFGDFVSVVNERDTEDETIFGSNPLETPSEMPDTFATRQKQHRAATRHALIKSFPFDVINLDLEGYLFKPSDQIPGDIIRALGHVFRWQREVPLKTQRGSEQLDEFTLMFTTQLGPYNLSSEYIEMISGSIDENIAKYSNLRDILFSRNGCLSGIELQEKDFNELFLIGAPKLIAKTLMDEDWYIDPENGIQIYKFERSYATGEYSMIHLVMDVKRKDPPKDKRPPGSTPPHVEESYKYVVEKLFQNPEIHVTLRSEGIGNLKPSLEMITKRRNLYYPDDIENQV